ncbi:MAG: Sec-dependent nitrous-oxide reductase [Candidatus Krumholzibacteria bacterium]|nr:Sec-dependent nitrous-oxide reductase [Candidatus Krumholzibacteria bacterium]MDH4337621.1 Sec-dependent nitrous-oxide reductase [Candidatus Krumholzibacteria bacterium]MDH5270423.1 Sec-dependent nitrous-oxide reductase [Candidatus Krumholzibacteria bacterium]MDH5626973.1 Sec-dependent nitrous-oxide reductase [Candidatus Krumholzibacteria bacterium]
MKVDLRMRKWSVLVGVVAVVAALSVYCAQKPTSTVMGSGADKVYVAPGTYDDFYAFMSGGFSGQVGVYGLPSGRLLRVVPVFSQNAENAWGYSEETKPMLNTSYGFIPWDDAHHPKLSQTNGIADGRWLFINGNNTPRIARLDLSTFETDEIIEIPNAGGNHASPFITMNTEYAVSSTRFSLPIPQKDVAISTYAENFKGTISFVKVAPDGRMSIAFQILVPGYNYDLAHAGKGPSHGWSFFTTYNTEQANTLLEVNASQYDKDYIAAVNWKKAEEYVAQGKAKDWPTKYYHNYMNHETQTTVSEVINTVKVLSPADCPGLVYYLPTPKSPHGVDVDPTGEYIAAGGKLATVIPVHSFTKMLKAIEDKAFVGEVDGIPVLDYNAVMAGEVQNPGLGPLHTEFDGKGFAYTSSFISSEIVKWNVGTWEVVDRIPVYYSIGHLMVPGGDTMKPWGKYVVALNKVTKDRYLPTGPELTQSAQLIDIESGKMNMLLDFPTIGEPHYAQAIPADIVMKNSKKYFDLSANKHPAAIKSEAEARLERKGSDVHVYMSTIRTHFMPDNIEGVKVGDTVYFHVTNLEQDWDVPHGFAIIGNQNAELLVMPGQTRTITWKPDREGVFPFYCTDFCSALHQEMSGYVRVSPRGSNVQLSSNK